MVEYDTREITYAIDIIGIGDPVICAIYDTKQDLLKKDGKKNKKTSLWQKN